MHVLDGSVVIPNMALKQSLDSAGSFMNLKIRGKGQQTWTKTLKTGMLIPNPLILGIDPKTVRGEWIMANSNGKRGSGTRVKRCFPLMDQWETTASILIFNDAITEDIFTRCLETSGKYIGLGRFRPENGGTFGRFEILKVDWKKS